MAIPITLDICREHLFTDGEEMARLNIAPVLQARVLRLRGAYTFWLQFPNQKDVEIVAKLMKEAGVSRTTAYEDVRIVKALLGDLNKSTKEFHRWKLCNMIMETYEKAKRLGDAKAMVAALDKYGKYTQLDKEDLVDRGFDKIQVQPFEPTDDPTVIGLKPIPNLRKKMQEKLAYYTTLDIEDVTFEEAEFDEDAIYHPKLPNDETLL